MCEEFDGLQRILRFWTPNENDCFKYFDTQEDGILCKFDLGDGINMFFIKTNESCSDSEYIGINGEDATWLEHEWGLYDNCDYSELFGDEVAAHATFYSQGD